MFYADVEVNIKKNCLTELKEDAFEARKIEEGWAQKTIFHEKPYGIILLF